jgi:flagellar assembly protein FliH
VSYVTIRRAEAKKSPSRKAGHDVAPDADSAAAETRIKAEIERLRQQAEAEGRSIGEAQGRQHARREAEADIRTAIAAINRATRQLEAPLRDREVDIAEMVASLAFVLARHVVGAELKANSESVKLLVQQLVREAAAERNPHQNIIVRLNPADLAAISADELVENTRLVADSQISRGGAFVEITSPAGDPIDKVEWDATVETRLTSIQQALSIQDEDGPEP